MRLKTFRGGVHAPDRKEATRDKPIEVLPAPARVVIPLQQHTGAPCEALVKEGDLVSLGQKIGESKSFVSAPVHASIAGKVTAVQALPHPVLPKPVLSVVIEAEAGAAGSPAGWSAAAGGWQALDNEEIKKRIREAGVVGLGGAAFPTHVKLSPSAEKPIDALILNGVECEPYLTNDHRLMLERGEEILEGARIVHEGAGRAPGLPRHRGQQAGRHPSHVRSWPPGAGVEVVGLKVKYPQGAEKQLIKAVLGREVPSGGLPFDVGVVVQNVGTVLAVLEAVARGKPLIERVLTVGGDGVAEPKNLLVRIGTSFAEVLAACGGTPLNGEAKVLMGGPMMGIAQYSLEVPVVKGTSGILVFRRGRQEKETPCIKCGRCVEVCPMYLMPIRIADYAEMDNFASASEYGVKDCIECGACAFVCDTKRPLVHLVKYAKWNLARKKQAKERSMSDRFVVSASPHLRDHDNTAKVMWWVVVALAPAAVGLDLYLRLAQPARPGGERGRPAWPPRSLTQLVFKRPITHPGRQRGGHRAAAGLHLPASSPWWMVAARGVRGHLPRQAALRRHRLQHLQPGARRPGAAALLLPGGHDGLVRAGALVLCGADAVTRRHSASAS